MSVWLCVCVWGGWREEGEDVRVHGVKEMGGVARSLLGKLGQLGAEGR